MTLAFCSDVSAARWIAASDLPWDRLVGFGPAGFEAYARLRFLPDPAYPGQSENDTNEDEALTTDQVFPALFEVLAQYTTTPRDCYVCVWDGYADDMHVLDEDTILVDDGDPRIDPYAVPGVDPFAEPFEPDLPRVVVPNREFFLFHGALTEISAWDDTQTLPDRPRLVAVEPAFVWPADHAWCFAFDVDPHWAGIGADAHVIARLLAHEALDAVPADPSEDQPLYC